MRARLSWTSPTPTIVSPGRMSAAVESEQHRHHEQRRALRARSATGSARRRSTARRIQTRGRSSSRAHARRRPRRPLARWPPRAASRARRRAGDSALIASATGSGRCAQSASGPSGRLPSTRTGWPGLPTTVEFGGTSWMITELAPTFAPRPTWIGPSSFAPEPTTTSSSTVGWRLPRAKPGAAERHPLVERHVVADLGRLADHDAAAVVDEAASRRSGRPGGSRRRSPSCSRTRWRAAPPARRPRAARARRDG